MGNLLIVDDEPDILETLEEIFKYEAGLGIDVYVAKSAINAVKLLEKIKFDVVMTDIKMPGMNGIELFKLIKENWPKCRVIFLTGYRDFDDLYEISGHKEVRYLLKSEEYDVLIANVAEAFHEINEMTISEMQESRYQSEIKKAQIILRKNLLKEYFRNRTIGNLTQDTLNQIDIPIQIDKHLFIFLLRIDHYKENISYEEEIEREKFLCETIQEFIPPRINFYLYYDSNGYYLLFLQPVNFVEDFLSARTWKRLYVNLVGALEYVQEKTLTLTSLSVSFITCDERCYIKDVQLYLSRMKQEAASKIGNSMQRLIKAKSEVALSPVKSTVNLQLKVKYLEEFLEARKYSDFIYELKQLTDLRYRKEDLSKTTELYYSIAILLLRFININHLKNKIEVDFSLDKLIYIEKHSNLEVAINYLHSIANWIINELETDGKNRTNEVLEKVLIYINSHLSEDLTLTKLAEISYLNASYLSRIFKQRYKCNITEYISKVRIEKAKNLLSTTSNKINDISLKVGYLSAPSFTRIFKKIVGISPVEYRDRYGEKNNEIFQQK